MNTLESLGPVELGISALPELCANFRIPKLVEKPQNPIMDSLQIWSRRSNMRLTDLKIDVVESSDVLHDVHQERKLQSSAESLWAESLKHIHSRTSSMKSWDTLTNRFAQTPSAFISERSSYTSSAARYIVLPTFQNETIHQVNVTPSELHESAQLTMCGLSSPLHTWNIKEEVFVLRGLVNDRKGILVISGLDHDESQSLIHRFVTIGTHLRRLEMLFSQLQADTASGRRHLHSLGYSLSSVLFTVKSVLSEIVASVPPPASRDDIHAISTLWLACAEIVEQLEDLATMFGRGAHMKPDEYPALPPDAPGLLSMLYKHLHTLLENHSSSAVIAVTAFMLTSASNDYLERICAAVGYSPQSSTTTKSSSSYRPSTGLFDDEIQEGEDLVDDATEGLDDTYPCFFSPKFAQGISRARKSLKLLRTASSGHPLLIVSRNRPKLRWIWSHEEIEAAWLSLDTTELARTPNGSQDHKVMAAPGLTNSEMALRAFQIFDLEPGTQPDSICAPSSLKLSSPFSSFVKDFPSRLSPITPTIETLRDLVMSPLATYIDSLSSALLDTFLPETSGYLDFRRHLTLLRSYLLLTSRSFRARLESALFCDAPEPVSNEQSVRATASRVRRSLSRRTSSEPKSDSWVVGLAPTLTESSTWPPGGSDLSFYLKTVIIDSLEADICPYTTNDGESHTGTMEEKDQLFEEAEWRLGFAIRDLPIGTRARWLNPRSIEAMDFLYMDYHPPQPLDVLVPQTTLSKYHRIFAFNLRLMRVENVTKALFRMTKQKSVPLFETLGSSRRLFLYFRFIASSFVTALSSYVYDVAIGGTFDRFLQSLTSLSQSKSDSAHSVFSDVFALAEHHSRVMDDILSACLLRSNQKDVGDLLRGALGVILEFAILMSDLLDGKLQEYEAAEPLEDLFSAFHNKMAKLRKTLKVLVDKSASLSESSSEQPDIHAMSGSLPPIAASLHDLLTRIQVPETWNASTHTV